MEGRGLQGGQGLPEEVRCCCVDFDICLDVVSNSQALQEALRSSTLMQQRFPNCCDSADSRDAATCRYLGLSKVDDIAYIMIEVGMRSVAKTTIFTMQVPPRLSHP